MYKSADCALLSCDLCVCICRFMRYKPKGRLQVYKGSTRCPSPLLPAPAPALELSNHAENVSERDLMPGKVQSLLSDAVTATSKFR